MQAKGSAKPRIRLRVEEYNRYADEKWPGTSNEARAREIGINFVTLYRQLDGTIAPGTQFIAALLAAFPELTFEELFEVSDGDGEVDRLGAAS